MSFLSPRRRRALAAGVLLVALGAAAVSTNLTGAWFTASSASPVTVTGALLSIGEIGKASDKTTIAVSDVYPMTDTQALANAVGVQARSEWVTVRNTGTIPLDWSMQIVNPVGKAPLTAQQVAMFRFQLFTEAGVKLTEPLTLGSRPSAAVPDGGIASGAGLAAGAQSKVEIRVWLDASADNAFQGAGASFDVVINAIQNGAGGLPTKPNSLTATPTGEPVGVTTALAWSAPGGQETGTFVVERSRTGDFSDAVEVYRGAGMSAQDASGSGATSGISKIVDSTAGGYEGCIVTDQGKAYCAGLKVGSDGSYGHSSWNWSSDLVERRTPREIKGGLVGKRVVKIDAVDDTFCAVTDDGELYCWGVYPGDGSASSPTPVRVGGVFQGKHVVEVKTGPWPGACALASDGTFACWGKSSDLGVYSTRWSIGSGSLTPVLVNTGALAGKRVIDFQVGYWNACAIASDRTFACWGSDGALRTLGAATSDNGRTPVAVTIPNLGAASIVGSTGTRWGSCVLTSASKVVCWGYLPGIVGTSNAGSAPVEIPTGPLTSISEIESPGSGLCARQGTSVYCWGGNEKGVLGLGLAEDAVVSTPTQVEGSLRGEEIVNLESESRIGAMCALTSDGRSFCWGYDAGWGGSLTPTRTASIAAVPAEPVWMPEELRCAGDAILLTGTTCSLSPATQYTYRVKYNLAGAADVWSGWTVARR